MIVVIVIEYQRNIKNTPDKKHRKKPFWGQKSNGLMTFKFVPMNSSGYRLSIDIWFKGILSAFLTQDYICIIFFKSSILAAAILNWCLWYHQGSNLPSCQIACFYHSTICRKRLKNKALGAYYFSITWGTLLYDSPLSFLKFWKNNFF